MLLIPTHESSTKRGVHVNDNRYTYNEDAVDLWVAGIFDLGVKVNIIRRCERLRDVVSTVGRYLGDDVHHHVYCCHAIGDVCAVLAD